MELLAVKDHVPVLFAGLNPNSRFLKQPSFPRADECRRVPTDLLIKCHGQYRLSSREATPTLGNTKTYDVNYESLQLLHCLAPKSFDEMLPP